MASISESETLNSSPSLSRNKSLSRLNARAPEFIPRPQDHQRLAVPPQAMVHVFPSFHNQHQFHQFYATVDPDQPQLATVDPDQVPFSRNAALSEEATQKLLNQVEYYFSDLNLATTDHLMRFISKDPEGYVPITIVAAFKKVKAVISNTTQLATLLRNSTKLVVSEDGKKVRRQQSLTESDMEELQSRIIVAENLPEDHCHQNLMKIFSAVGSVKTIRTCQPQNSNNAASSASRSAKTESALYSNKLHAFVEYESIELAERAVAELNEEGNWRSGLRVRLMVKRTLKPGQVRGKKVGNDGDEEDSSPTTTTALSENGKQVEECDVRLHEHVGEEQLNEKESQGQGGHKRGRGRGGGRGRGHGQGQGRGRPHHNNNRTSSSSLALINNNTNNNINSNEQPTVSKQPPGPRMPDGTRGFSMGRGKPIAVNVMT